jgi:putative mycofactocin binding protein MftB
VRGLLIPAVPGTTAPPDVTPAASGAAASGAVASGAAASGAAASEAAAFEAAVRYELHPDVALRPEPFGALAYHYGSRRLTFLRSPLLVEVVRTLGDHPSVRAAVDAHVPPARRPGFLRAIASLADSKFIVPAAPATADSTTADPTTADPTTAETVSKENRA